MTEHQPAEQGAPDVHPGLRHSTRQRGLFCVIICVALLAGYAIAAWTAVARESPTYDEPYHAVAAWAQSHRHDFRIDNEDPPLWLYWASLANGRDALHADFDGRLWRNMATDVPNQWEWMHQTLYGTAGNDAAGFVARCRAMMLIVAVALGAMIALWAWRLGGGLAAVSATAMFAFDPNFLAHGSLMKNDVAASLAWLALAWSLWDVGRRGSIASIARLVALAALPITVKYNGVLAAPLVPAVLGARALSAQPWIVCGRSLVNLRQRLMAAGRITLLAAVVGFVAIWAVYGFRFRSGPDLADRLDVTMLADRASDHERKVHPGSATPGLAVRLVMVAEQHHVLPEPFLAGFLFTYGESLVRPSYLLGEVSYTGWWYFFPLVMLMKTPLATLIAGAGTIGVVLRHRRKITCWSAIGLGAPVVVYMASAMTTNLNIGLRHVLPVYPPMFVAMGCAIGFGVRRWGRPAIVLASAMAIGLAVETATAWPHLIPFTNGPTLAWAGSDRRRLFTDSNFDWGQDLPLLAEWQRDHRDAPLFLAYFGLADPRSYGLAYTALPGGYTYDSPPRRFPPLDRPAWVAVSASLLQSTPYTDPRFAAYYGKIAKRSPVVILGGSIYVFRADPFDQIELSSPGLRQ